MKLFLSVALVLLLSAGCSGQQGPRSFTDFLGATILLIDTAADTVFELCRNEVPGGPCAAGAPMATEQKEDARRHLEEALDTVEVARQLYVTGSTDLAYTRLSEARRLIAVVEGVIARAES